MNKSGFFKPYVDFFVIYFNEMENEKFEFWNRFSLIHTSTFLFSNFINCDVSRNNAKWTNKLADLQPAFKRKYVDGCDAINKRARCINPSQYGKRTKMLLGFHFSFEIWKQICLQFTLIMPFYLLLQHGFSTKETFA